MSPRNADPRVDRARHGSALLCARGDHEDCAAWLAGVEQVGVDVYRPPVPERRCGCGCHVDPWPFEHDG